MNKFGPILRELNHKLDLPRSTKARVILEIAADLQASYEYYLQANSEQDAFNMAVEKFQLDGSALQELQQVYSQGINRWFDRLARFRFEWWGQLSLVALLLFLVLLTINQMNIVDLVSRASGFIWGTIVIGLAAAIIFIERIFSLYVLNKHVVTTLRNGLGGLLILAVGSIVCGGLGTSIEFYRMARMVFYQPQPFLPAFVFALDRSAALSVFSLLLAMIIAMIWYILLQKVVSIEQDEVAVLLGLEREQDFQVDSLSEKQQE